MIMKRISELILEHADTIETSLKHYRILFDETEKDERSYIEDADNAVEAVKTAIQALSLVTDEEKMEDFRILSREEFLDAYDYLTDEDYRLLMTYSSNRKNSRKDSGCVEHIFRKIAELAELRHNRPGPGGDSDVLQFLKFKSDYKKFEITVTVKYQPEKEVTDMETVENQKTRVKVILGLENRVDGIHDVAYLCNAAFKPGRIMSGYNSKILTEEGGYEIEPPEGQGWIYADKDFNVLEKNIRGHHYIRIEPEGHLN
jgi:hypothetical protein